MERTSLPKVAGSFASASLSIAAEAAERFQNLALSQFNAPNAADDRISLVCGTNKAAGED
jgi:hypothetical protein